MALQNQYYNLQATAGPRLKILEQPSAHYHFRYTSEMQTFHGVLKGSNEKAYPTVQLLHCQEEDEANYFIRVFLFTADYERHVVYQFALKGAGEELRPYADIDISYRNEFKAIFEKLIIIQKTKTQWIKEEVEAQRHVSPHLSKDELEEQAKKTWNEKYKNQRKQVRLGFCAYNNHVKICGPVFSDVISEKVDGTVGELKITRISPFSGGKEEEMILLVSKIAKSKVEVRFFEGEQTNPSWETYAHQICLHHQVALIIQVPKYKEEISIDLQVQLERTESDGSKSRSEPRPFRYKPKRLYGKRRLSTPSNFSSIVDPIRPRMIGGSSSEGSIQIQREEQIFNTVQSWPNAAWENQSLNAQNSLVQGNSSEQLPQLFNGLVFANDIQEMGFSIEEINPQHAVTQMDGTFPSFEQNILEDLETSLDIPAWSNTTWEVDLADSANKWKTKQGKVKQDVVTDSVGNNNASGSTSLKPNKDKSRVFASIEGVNMQRVMTWFSLFEATRAGNASKLDKLLKCMDTREMENLINETYGLEQTPLIIIAVEENHDECAKMLCLAGANVNLADEEENTSYHIAAKKNYVKCLEILLKVKNKNLDKKNAIGEAPLHLAALYNSVESVKMLLEEGAKVNERNCTAGSTPLHLAVQQGHTELVRHFLQQENINLFEVNYEDKKAADLVKANQEDIISLFEGIIIDIEEETTDEEE